MAEEVVEQVEQVTDGLGEVVQGTDNQPEQSQQPTQTQTAQAPAAFDPQKAFADLQAQMMEKLQGVERQAGQYKGLQSRLDKFEALIKQANAPQTTPSSLEALPPDQRAQFDKLMAEWFGSSQYGKEFNELKQMKVEQQRMAAASDGYSSFMRAAGQDAEKLQPFATQFVNDIVKRAGEGDAEANQYLDLLVSNPVVSAKLMLAEAKEAYAKSVQAQSESATNALKAKGQQASPTPQRSGAKSEDSLEAIQAMPRGPEKTAKLEAYIAANGGMEAFLGAKG